MTQHLRRLYISYKSRRMRYTRSSAIHHKIITSIRNRTDWSKGRKPWPLNGSLKFKGYHTCYRSIDGWNLVNGEENKIIDIVSKEWVDEI